MTETFRIHMTGDGLPSRDWIDLEISPVAMTTPAMEAWVGFPGLIPASVLAANQDTPGRTAEEVACAVAAIEQRFRVLYTGTNDNPVTDPQAAREAFARKCKEIATMSDNVPDALAEAAANTTARMEARKAGEVKAWRIKPLWWDDFGTSHKACGFCVLYIALPDGRWEAEFTDPCRMGAGGRAADLEAAKAACEEHWRGVLSAALEPVETIEPLPAFVDTETRPRHE